MPDPSFFLGRLCDPLTGEPDARIDALPADHLTTHAMCVGMTSTGGLWAPVSLAEELQSRALRAG